MKYSFFLFLILFSFQIFSQNIEEDKYLWLEDIKGEKALAWVKEQNKRTAKIMEKNKEFKRLKKEILEILNSKERIPYISKNCEHYYNFWKDEKNPRGLWRRTTLEEYKKKEPKWEVMFNLDEFNKKEGINWVWEGADILEPECKKALIYLSRGGSDANIAAKWCPNKTYLFVGT